MVYRARDTVIGRTVALKVMELDPSLSEAGRGEMFARIEREARAAGLLNHPNIVTVHDAGRSPEAGAFYLVMEHVEGTTLRALLAEGPLPEARALAIARQVAAALDFAHRKGIVHRDVKPANILIRRDGIAKIADFGIARIEASELTRTGQWVGSPAYMSPEQAQGRQADRRSDVFSLGLVLYEMVTGRRAFRAETLAGLAFQIANRMPPPPSSRAPSLSPGWDAVILRAIAKDPERRYPTAGALAADLARMERGEEPEAASVAGAWPRAAAGWETDPAVEDAPQAAVPAAEEEPIPLRLATGESAVTPAARSAATTSRLFRASPSRPGLVVASVLFAGLWGILALGALPGRTPGAAVLRVEVVDQIGEGRVAVTVDGATVWAGALEAAGVRDPARRPVKSAGLLPPPSRATAEVELSPGDHLITVAVATGGGGPPLRHTVRRRLDAGSTATMIVHVENDGSPRLRVLWG